LRNPVAGVSQIGWDDVSAFSNFFLFSMVAGFVLVAGNLYCGWICPLGSLQRVTARFSRFLTRRVKLAALFLVFVLQAYAMYVTRPAADFFTENIIAFWALFLLVVMALSLLVPRFRDYLAGIRYASMFLYVLITGLGVWFSEAWCWLTGSDIDYSSLIAFTVIFLASAVIPMAWCSLLCPTGTFLSLLGKQSFLKHKGPDADSEKN
jgi:polyferredoxin